MPRISDVSSALKLAEIFQITPPRPTKQLATAITIPIMMNFRDLFTSHLVLRELLTDRTLVLYITDRSKCQLLGYKIFIRDVSAIV